MTNPTRMSPLTAFFLGLFSLGIVGVIAGTAITLDAVHRVDRHVDSVFDLADHAVADLPGLIDSLPPALKNALSDRRAPEYVKSIDVKVRFAPKGKSGATAPALTITNSGEEVISLLAVRVSALDGQGMPLAEWTEVVATPLAFNDDDWRGPILPGGTRHVILSGLFRRESAEPAGEVTAAYEIADVRIWQPQEDQVRSASSHP